MEQYSAVPQPPKNPKSPVKPPKPKPFLEVRVELLDQLPTLLGLCAGYEKGKAAFEFQRNWAGFIFPRFLGALDSIQKEIFGRLGLPPGNYSFYATLIEHLFLEPEISALEEYGLPTEVGRKLKIDLELRTRFKNGPERAGNMPCLFRDHLVSGAPTRGRG